MPTACFVLLFVFVIFLCVFVCAYPLCEHPPAHPSICLFILMFTYPPAHSTARPPAQSDEHGNTSAAKGIKKIVGSFRHVSE